tara:strand:+ start:216 stop:377 length:162 start_codon:yes stop_codon:yes gene_type:complete
MDYIKIIANLEDEIQRYVTGEKRISSKEHEINKKTLKHFKENLGKKSNDDGQS